MSINFQRIINICIKKNLMPTTSPEFAGTTKCDNCFFGSLKGNKITAQRSSINRNKINQNNSTIVIILAESPHVDEYTFNNGNILSNGPLIKYDNKICSNLGLYLSGVSSADVYLFNSIPYQCSFGNSLYGKNNYNKQKNDVFSLTWNLELALSDLVFEIKNLIKNDERLIILNSCTEKLKPCCNSHVLKEQIESNGIQVQVINTPHVSHW